MLQYIWKWEAPETLSRSLRNDLCVTFRDIDFSNDDNDYYGDPANESLRSSY